MKYIVEIKDEGGNDPVELKGLRPFLVFSTTRDIFFGWCEEAGPRMKLRNARRVYYYATASGVGGPDQLATLGPATGSKIGPTVGVLTVENVANSVEVQPQALKAWSGDKWTM